MCSIWLYNYTSRHILLFLLKVTVIIINSIKDKLEKSTNHSNPFIGVDELGNDWFVKTYFSKSGHETNALFNELVAFKLAEKIGLPWPKGHLVQFSESVKSELNVSTSHFIAYEFMHNLEELPEGYQFSNNQIKNLYGKSIFDNWLSIGDVKNDTCKLLNGELLFMDAGIAFEDDNCEAWGKVVLYGQKINCLLNHRHIIAEFCILQKSINHVWIKFVKYLLNFINPSQIASLKIGMFRKVTN